MFLAFGGTDDSATMIVSNYIRHRFGTTLVFATYGIGHIGILLAASVGISFFAVLFPIVRLIRKSPIDFMRTDSSGKRRACK